MILTFLEFIESACNIFLAKFVLTKKTYDQTINSRREGFFSQAKIYSPSFFSVFSSLYVLTRLPTFWSCISCPLCSFFFLGLARFLFRHFSSEDIPFSFFGGSFHHHHFIVIRRIIIIIVFFCAFHCPAVLLFSFNS